MARGRGGGQGRGRREQKRTGPAVPGTEDKVAISKRHWRTLLHLIPYLWPKGRPDLRTRVVLAVIVMILAKIVTVWMPFFYKGSVDALTPHGHNLIVVPVALILGSAGAPGDERRPTGAGLALRVRWPIRAARDLGRDLHAPPPLSLRFHLERRTGGLARLIERGANAVDTLLRWLIFNIVPTLIELGLVCAILIVRYSAGYAWVTGATVIGYIAFTVVLTDWRTKYYRDMVAKDAEAGTRAVDSLINFETVKYFGNEGWETARYDDASRLMPTPPSNRLIR